MKINAAVSVTASGGSVTTTGITTRGGKGSVFCILVQSRAAGNTPTDSKGNTYTAVTAENTATLGGVNYFLRAWTCASGIGGTSHTATATNGGATFITEHFFELQEVSALDTSNAWVTDATAAYVSNSLSPSTSRPTIVIGFNAIFSTASGSTWTHSGDGFTQLTAFTNGVTGPCSEVAYKLAAGGTHTTNLSAVNPVSETAMSLFSLFLDQQNWRPLNSVATPGLHPGPRSFAPLARGYPAVAASANLDVSIDTAGQVTLAGKSVSSSIAVPISNGAVTLAGQSFTANLGTPISAGAVTLAGQSVVASLAVPVSAGAVTLGGQTVTSTIGLPVDIVAGAITLAGQSFTSSIAVPITAGAVLLAGQSLTIALAVPVAAGAVTLAGQDATIGIAGGSGNLSVSIDAAGQITLSGQTFAVDLAGQPSGVVDVTGGGASYGAQFWFHYEREQQRRRKRRRELQEAEEAAEAIAEPVTQEIAQILQQQERKDDQRAELERLRELVARLPLETGSPRLQAAVDRVRERQTFSSLVALDKELRRMMDEEDAALVMLLLGD